MVKKKVEDSSGTSLGTRSSNWLKKKATAAQTIAPEDGEEKASKSPQKRRNAKKNVDAVAESKGVDSKRDNSKKCVGSENDEGTDSAGTS